MQLDSLATRAVRLGALACCICFSAPGYSAERAAPEIPKDRPIRVIIDTDAKHGIDDRWAIALAILSPDRFHIEGFVSAPNLHGGTESIERSAREIELLLEKTGQAGKWPVKRGSHPLQYPNTPNESEGVDFIIRKAMESTSEDPLWVVGLGAATNIASAYLKEPRIADRTVAFVQFHSVKWPEKCLNNNVLGDVHAARILFHAKLPLVLFDAGAQLTCPLPESKQRVRPRGELGRYLHDYRQTNNEFLEQTIGFFDLGAIAALADPAAATWEVADRPELGWDLSYRFEGTQGKILRCSNIDREKALGLFYSKLKKAPAFPPWESAVDVLVVAPHPDDEVLGCAGMILQALEQNKRVGVVILTNGDGFPRAAEVITKKTRARLSQADFFRLAAERQQQSLDGLAVLGVPRGNLTFLGYPDSALAVMYRSAETEPVVQLFTAQSHTYGIVGEDYHSQLRGRPAPYTKASLLGDLVDILQSTKPKKIYVTHDLDLHSDHKAAFWFVQDAIRAADYRGELLAYINHGTQQPDLPLQRVQLSAAQVKAKRDAIRPHQIPIVHDDLPSFAKESELFWLVPTDESR